MEKTLDGQESKYFASWEVNLFALERGTGSEGSKSPVGAQFRPISTSTVEKRLPLHAVDVGFAMLQLNMPKMPLVGLLNTISVYVSQYGNMSY